MLDIAKQVTFWRNGAQEDLTMAQELLESERIRHGLFFLHLALEKLRKAHVCRPDARLGFQITQPRAFSRAG
jgi:HEPN domain-containing protein